MWSAQDMLVRAPIIFWQGFVRLTAVAAIIHMARDGRARGASRSAVPLQS